MHIKKLLFYIQYPWIIGSAADATMLPKKVYGSRATAGRRYCFVLQAYNNFLDDVK